MTKTTESAWAVMERAQLAQTCVQCEVVFQPPSAIGSPPAASVRTPESNTYRADTAVSARMFVRY